MTRVFPHGVLALAGCLLVASLVCGGPPVASALARPGADGRPLALAGTRPLPVLPGPQGPGVLVWQALARATHRQRGPL